jgi:exopolysaccharide production protein ExoQ
VSQIAALVFALGITALFLLERDRKNKTSRGLLLPCAWMLVAGSRNIGEWLQMGAPTEGDAYLEGNPLDRNLLSILIAIGIIILIQRRQKVGALLRANAPLLLYFGYCVLSVLWSDYPFVGFKRWIRAIGDLVMVLIVLTERDRLLSRKRFYAWVGFLLLPISVLLIRWYSELGRSYSIFDGQVFWTGVTSNKNELGMICMIFGLASLSRVLDIFRGREGTVRTRGRLIAHSVIVLMAMWLLHIADSATSLACFMIGSTLLVLTSLRPFVRTPALVHLLVAALLGVAVCSLFLGLGTGLVNDLGRNSTLTGRTEMWAHAIKLVDNPVFGAGYESFWVGTRLEKMRIVAPGVNQAHNGYLEVYLNLGWAGVTLLGVVILTGYRTVFRAFRRDPDPARLRLAFLVAALSYGFTEAGAFKFRNPVWISFMIAIVAIPMIRSQRGQKSIAAASAESNPRNETSAKTPVLEECI